MPLALPGLLARGFARFICGTDGRQPATWLGAKLTFHIFCTSLAFRLRNSLQLLEYVVSWQHCGSEDKDLG